jgi:hypothetical protein
MNLLEQIEQVNRIMNVLEPLRKMFKELEEAIEANIEEEYIINKSYRITAFIQENDITPEEEIAALEMVGANHPMSVLAEWYEETQYRKEVK